jgi:glycosyltransferase involved in cell wall biosynthesis
VKVSVIVPTFNRVALLSETVESILAQTFSGFELLVVDNGSIDHTAELVETCRERDGRVRYLYHNDRGIAQARNAGLRAARGEYVAFCDDDDLWRSGKLQVQVDLLERRPDVALICTNAVTFGEGVPEHPVYRRPPRTLTFKRLLRQNEICNSSVLVCRAVLDRVGWFDERPEFHAVEDYELWLRVAHGHRIVFLDRPLVWYRAHNRANRRRGVEMVEAWRAVVDKLWATGLIDCRVYASLTAKIEMERRWQLLKMGRISPGAALRPPLVAKYRLELLLRLCYLLFRGRNTRAGG